MEIFKKEMKLKGLTVADLAIKINITQSNIHAWIAGNHRPSARYIPKLQELGFSDTACLDPSKDVEV